MGYLVEGVLMTGLTLPKLPSLVTEEEERLGVGERLLAMCKPTSFIVCAATALLWTRNS